MKNIIAVFVIGTLLFGLFTGCAKKEPPSQSNPEAEKAAVAAADVWLKLVDVAQYDKSWQEAAEFFRNALSQQDWQKSMETFRKPLGAVVSRTLKSRLYTTTAPGAPDGQYVIIQYDSSFENKKSAVETVTPMLDKDGKWRVSGYYIK
jgi:hypothetical protein